jgi:hypothetical protein
MPTNEEIAQKLTKACLDKSEGDWEKLKYKVIDAARMRKFIKLIAVYGNSIRCVQASVNDIENILIKCKSFAEFKLNYPEMIKYGMSRGFAYLFTTLSMGDIFVSIESCRKVYVRDNVNTGTSEVVSPHDLAYSTMDEVD